MNLRRIASVLGLPLGLMGLGLALVLGLSGCGSLKGITITPAAGVEVLTAVGQTAQYTAIGSSEMGSGNPTSSNITGSVAWSVSNPSVATINANGLATAIGAGYTQIVAISNGIAATSDLTVDIATVTLAPPTVTLTPNLASATFSGETVQFLATGNLTGSGGSLNLTNQVAWVSSNVQVATINSSGLATAVGSGSTTITAVGAGATSTSTLTVTTSSTGSAGSAVSLSILPSASGGASASFTGETTQFVALGNLTGVGGTENLTQNVAWSSSDVAIATIDQNGLATAVGANTTPETTTITAIGTSVGGSLVTATSAFTVLPGTGTVSLPTLTIYEVGTGAGTVTSTPLPIVCAASGTATACSGTFQLGSTVTLTAAPSTTTTPASVFGGWSSNCTPVVGNALQCTIKMVNNETVGVTFNP